MSSGHAFAALTVQPMSLYTSIKLTHQVPVAICPLSEMCHPDMMSDTVQQNQTVFSVKMQARFQEHDRKGPNTCATGNAEVFA